jgi:hypothetical protein
MEKDFPRFDPLDRPLWGAENIAAVINRTPRQTYYALEQGYLDADKVGAQWCTTPRRLLTLKPRNGGVE